MGVKPSYRDRPAVEVAILDALVDRANEGMTVLELRAAVDADIDRIEAALSALKADGLITADETDGMVRIHPTETVIAEPGSAAAEPSIVESIRDRFGL